MMTPENLLKEYIKKSKPFLEKLFKPELILAQKISPVAARLVKTYERFMGGKSLRGALTYYSYRMFGGQDEKSILAVSTSIDITHAFLLMHDDIMDQDERRRGRPTVHRQYEKIFGQKVLPPKSQHLGLSLAIITGDLGPYFANLILEQTQFDPEIKLRFLKILSRTIVNTAYGQALDLIPEKNPKLNLSQILKIHRYKTAQYTISGPLKYGAILAGVNEESKPFLALDSYGLPVGVAFQLRDDELGLFANKKILGKSIDSDLRQGKNTILFEKTFEKGTPEQVKLLKLTFGQPALRPEVIDQVRQAVVDCGALAFSQKLSRQLVSAGKKFIPKITKKKYFRNLLNLTADYVIERTN